MADHDDLVQQFCAVTGADPQAARHFLEASNWDPEAAATQYFDTHDAAMGDAAESADDDDDALYSRPQQAAGSASGAASSSAPKDKSKAKPSSKFATLGDLRRAADDEDESDDEKKHQEYFAGGDKSGLAIEDPNNRDGQDRGLIQEILRRAEHDSRHSEEAPSDAGPASRFSGTGHTLGSDDTPSRTIPDPNTSRHPLEPVTRSLTFWRQGFSVEDGPLMRYDDPHSQDIMQAIQSGRAPPSVMGVEPGQPTNVNVFKRMDEDYQPPKKKVSPFSGAGQRLGAPTPGESIGSSSTASPPPAAAAPAASPEPAPPSVNVDASAPTTNLQIRLGDGTRLVSRFNHTHTVGDVYGFVNASSVASRSRDYVLQTTFPNKEYTDLGVTLKDAGLVNAVVVQKWK